MKRKTLFLHIGTHKTGTTSLQVMLEGLDDGRNDALCVPRNGRLPVALSGSGAGHHNIGFELTDDRRFDPCFGVLDDAIAEIVTRRARRAILSSEAFQFLHAVPAGLERLAAASRSTGYDIRVVVFLRSRVEYAESLYAELVKHGLKCGFSEFVRIVLRDGTFAFVDNRRYPFAYSVLVDRFAAVFGPENLIVRAYDARRPSRALHDELRAIVFGDAIEDVPPLPEIARVNPSLWLSGVLAKRYENVADERRTITPAQVAESFGDEGRAVFEGRFAPLGVADVEKFRVRFADDDARLERSYGIRLPAPERPPERDAALQRRMLDAADERWGSLPARSA